MEGPRPEQIEAGLHAEAPARVLPEAGDTILASSEAITAPNTLVMQAGEGITLPTIGEVVTQIRNRKPGEPAAGRMVTVGVDVQPNDRNPNGTRLTIDVSGNIVAP